MRIDAQGVQLWFDVSGPSVVLADGAIEERPTVVAVHGGPGIDHVGLKATLAPLAKENQIIYYDQRGHGRSEFSDPEHWNLATWADDLKNLCDALGIHRPVIFGTSFGGFVALRYAVRHPGHAAGLVLSNTTGGRIDVEVSISEFRRIGGEAAGLAAARHMRNPAAESAAEFDRLCIPLYSASPGYSGAPRWQQDGDKYSEVNLHYHQNEVGLDDPWEGLDAVASPVLILAGEDDPLCPLPLVRALAAHLPAQLTQVEVLPGARHTIFRDQPQLAYSFIREFVRRVAPPPRAGC